MVVMAADGGECQGGLGSPAPREHREPRERVSDREKELAGDASTAFTKGDYTGCLTSLEKLEVGWVERSSWSCSLYWHNSFWMVMVDGAGDATMVLFQPTGE